MKVSRLLLIAPLLACLSAGEQRYVYQTAVIEFTQGSSNLERSVIDQMDALFNDMPDGWHVELKVVAEDEIRNDYDRACRVSQQRCNALMEYLASRGIDEFDITVHQYREHLLVRSVPLTSKYALSRKYVSGISFTKEEQLPLMFTNSTLPQSNELCMMHGLNNSKYQVIRHPMGVDVHIPPYAFEDYNGYDPDCGRINIQICYYADAQDFARGGVTSNSGKVMLESGGMVYVGATCAGADLKLINGKEITVVMPNTSTSGGDMTFFSGREEYGLINWKQSQVGSLTTGMDEDVFFEDDEFDGGGRDTIWSDEDMETGELIPVVVSSGGEGDQFFITTSKLGWINADYFYHITQPQRLAVHLNEQKRDIAVRMVFKDINAVMPGYYYNNDSLVMFDGIPTGEPVTVLAYGTVDGQVYWDSRDVTVGETRMIKLDPQPLSSGQSLDDLISAL